jgi:hypothetical protein
LLTQHRKTSREASHQQAGSEVIGGGKSTADVELGLGFFALAFLFAKHSKGAGGLGLHRRTGTFGLIFALLLIPEYVHFDRKDSTRGSSFLKTSVSGRESDVVS